MPPSIARTVIAHSMNARALPSIFWNFRPISSSRFAVPITLQTEYRDVAEFFLVRGVEFTHETVRDWEERFAPIFADELRAKRKGKVGKVWYVDETYIRVQGRWCYLYRAIDQDGNLVDSRLSETGDMAETLLPSL